MSALTATTLEHKSNVVSIKLAYNIGLYHFVVRLCIPILQLLFFYLLLALCLSFCTKRGASHTQTKKSIKLLKKTMVLFVFLCSFIGLTMYIVCKSKAPTVAIPL